MLKFLVIRHGQTHSNVEKRFSGHQDVSLTDEGIWQAQQISNRLSQFRIDAVYSSDLERSIHTAKIILQNHNVPLQIEPDFRELSFGDWEGLRFEEIDFKKGEKMMDWWDEPEVPLPGGESVFDFHKRISDGLERVIQENNNHDEQKTIAIVCHGGVARVMVGIALDIPIRKIWYIKQQSTALNIIRYAKKSVYFVESVNDISHLKTEKESTIEK